MKIRSLAAAATIGSMILLAQGAAQAAEVKVLCAGGISSAVNELGAQFERASGHKLVKKFVSGPLVKREIDAGTQFDVAISLPDVIDAAIKDGKIVAATRAKENLFITYPINIFDRATGMVLSKPSRFLDGISRRILEPVMLMEEDDEREEAWRSSRRRSW